MRFASMGLRKTKNNSDISEAPLCPSDAAALLRHIYGIGALCCLVVSISALLSEEFRIAVLGASSALLFCLLHLLARTERVGVAGILGTGFLLCLLLSAVVTGHGIRDLSFAAFAFVILQANLVLDTRSAQVASFGTWLVALGTAEAEYLGLYHTDFSSHTNAHSVIVVGVVYLGIALTSRLLVRAYHNGQRGARSTRQSYRHIFNATTDAILLIDPQSNSIVDANRSAVAMFGYNRNELLEAPIEKLGGSRQDLAGVEGLLENDRIGSPSLFQWTPAHQSGSELNLEVSLQSAIVGEEEVLLAILHDTTENRSLHSKVRESEQLQVVGQLAGGIAHDFNNQLTGILANATLLSDKLTDERLKKSADVIVRCCRRSSDLTSQLLAFARRGKHQNVKVDLHELILEVVALLEHTIDKRIELKTKLENTHLKVLGDPTLLQNALLNLGLNARDAMPLGGCLSFEACRQLIEVTRVGISAALPHGDYASITVSDTGEGMDERTLKRIFEPFFTTKAQGNGMGLAAVYGTIESHRGDISVQSQEGKGTSFTLLLPLCDNDQESLSFKTALSPLRFDDLRVLVAEDEPDVALSTVALLEEMGCQVTLCKNGREAVDSFEADPSAYDLVLVDHMMPGLTGREALSSMRHLNPNLSSVITSGFSNETVIDKTSEKAIFLPKPFNQLQLNAALAKALARNDEIA